MAAEAEPLRDSTVELEFNQAMRDFQTMFPDMDPEIIEVNCRCELSYNNESLDFKRN
jgi:hypothetical protein